MMFFYRGKVFYINRGPGTLYKAHVMGLIDGKWVVFRWYGRHKQWWHYEIEQDARLDFLLCLCYNRGIARVGMSS